MGFGGSAAAMMQSIKLNKAQLKSSKSYFDKDKSYAKAYGDFVDHKKMTPAQFEAFKSKLKKRGKRKPWAFNINFGDYYTFGYNNN
jgi:hypothetical protein